MRSGILDETGEPLRDSVPPSHAIRVFFKRHRAVIISNLMAGIALTISAISMVISVQGNRIADEAVKASREQFIQLNRPYLIISPKKYDDGSFWEITHKGDSIELVVKYQLKNVGNVGAKDITLPELLALGSSTELKQGAPLRYERPLPITLGPGDDVYIEPHLLLGFGSEEDAQRNIEHLNSGESNGVHLSISVTYGGEVDDSRRYTTLMENRFQRHHVIVVKAETATVPVGAEATVEK